MYRTLRTIFVSGLVVVLPAALTVYLIFWLVNTADTVMQRVLSPLLGDAESWPGLGIVLAIGIILLVGMLMRVWGFRSLLSYGQTLLERLPFIKAVYGPLRDLVDLFNPDHRSARGSPVALKLGDYGEVIGFVTSDAPPFPAQGEDADVVAVYLPMSYQLGGYTLYVSSERIRTLEMSADEAMKLTLTAGVTRKSGSENRGGGVRH